MTKTNLKTMAATALILMVALSVAAPANAGNGNVVGAGLLGLGIGAIVGSALTPREVYVASPPVYYGPIAYGPPPWTPTWYRYCRSLHGPYFDPRSGYFRGGDGGWYFCH